MYSVSSWKTNNATEFFQVCVFIFTYGFQILNNTLTNREEVMYIATRQDTPQNIFLLHNVFKEPCYCPAHVIIYAFFYLKNWNHTYFTRYVIMQISILLCRLDILFSSNRNIHKSSCGLCFWASDTLIKVFY